MYAIEPGQQLEAEVKRIARHQVRQAIDELGGFGDHPEQAIHECRKHCKKIRGLARLVRPALGPQYRPANNAFRDASSRLSKYRDAHALLATFDAVIVPTGAERSTPGLEQVRAGLERRATEASQHLRRDRSSVDDALRLLAEGHRLIDQWRLDPGGYRPAIDGLNDTYRTGRQALEATLAGPTAEAFHEYRKQVKYTWYHLRLLDDLAPSMLGSAKACAGALAETLGQVNDLAVMSEWLEAEPGDLGGAGGQAETLRLIHNRQADLQTRSISVALRLHGEEPTAFAKRIDRYWAIWREHGPEMALDPNIVRTNGQ